MAKAVQEDVCSMCSGSGLLNVPVRQVRAKVTLNGRLNFQRTLNYVPTDVYGIRQCPKCDGRGGKRKTKLPKEQSPYLPGCDPNGRE